MKWKSYFPSWSRGFVDIKNVVRARAYPVEYYRNLDQHSCKKYQEKTWVLKKKPVEENDELTEVEF